MQAPPDRAPRPCGPPEYGQRRAPVVDARGQQRSWHQSSDLPPAAPRLLTRLLPTTSQQAIAEAALIALAGLDLPPNVGGLLLLRLEICVNLLPMAQIVGDDGVDIGEREIGERLDDRLRAVAPQESAHH